MLIDEHAVAASDQIIARLVNDFRESPGLLLTEADLKCELFRRLTIAPHFAGLSPSHDADVLATAVHSEVTWFDERNRLALRPDITILDPRNLSVRSAVQQDVPLPSKGFHFRGNAIIMEFKFIRDAKPDMLRVAEDYRRDLRKIERLMVRARPEATVYGFAILLAKYNINLDGIRGVADEFVVPGLMAVVEAGQLPLP